MSQSSPPPTGPKECKHYLLFDLKALILYFKPMLIHMCTAAFRVASKAGPLPVPPPAAGTVVPPGELLGSAPPSSVCSIADFGL